MPLAVCSDLSPADWIVASDIPWPPGVSQQFGVPNAGSDTFDARYSAGPNGPNQTRTATISVNGTSQGQIQLPLTEVGTPGPTPPPPSSFPQATIELSVGPSDTAGTTSTAGQSHGLCRSGSRSASPMGSHPGTPLLPIEWVLGWCRRPGRHRVLHAWTRSVPSPTNGEM